MSATHTHRKGKMYTSWAARHAIAGCESHCLFTPHSAWHYATLSHPSFTLSLHYLPIICTIPLTLSKYNMRFYNKSYIYLYPLNSSTFILMKVIVLLSLCKLTCPRTLPEYTLHILPIDAIQQAMLPFVLTGHNLCILFINSIKPEYLPANVLYISLVLCMNMSLFAWAAVI